MARLNNKKYKQITANWKPYKIELARAARRYRL